MVVGGGREQKAQVLARQSVAAATVASVGVLMVLVLVVHDDRLALDEVLEAAF